jgi:DNA-binding MarR family transcriptional regulator
MRLSLNENEKIALYGLVKYPTLQDSDVAEKIDLKYSTFNLIKKRLKKRDYYHTVAIPCLQQLGCELINVNFGWIAPRPDLKLSVVIPPQEMLKNPEFFYEATESDQGISITMSCGITDVRIGIENLYRKLAESDLLDDRGITSIYFPFKLAKIYRFFDFAPLLKRTFGLEVEEEEKEFTTCFMETKQRKLSQVEKQVYYGLIRYPESSDVAIAKKISIGRHTVGNMRKMFEEEKLITTIRIPNMNKLDLKILALTYSKFNPKNPLEMRKEGIKMILRDFPNILMITSNLESINLFVLRDFHEFQNVKDIIISYYKEKNFFAEEPVILNLSIPRMLIHKNFEFAPLVKKVLGL